MRKVKIIWEHFIICNRHSIINNPKDNRSKDRMKEKKRLTGSLIRQRVSKNQETVKSSEQVQPQPRYGILEHKIRAIKKWACKLDVLHRLLILMHNKKKISLIIVNIHLQKVNLIDLKSKIELINRIKNQIVIKMPIARTGQIQK